MLEFFAGLCSGAVLTVGLLVLLLFRLASWEHVGRPDGDAGKRVTESARRMLAASEALHGPPGAPRDVDGMPAPATAAFESLPEYLQGYQDGTDSESAAWLDILVFRIFSSVAAHLEASGVDLERELNARLSGVRLPEFVGPIVVHDLFLGTVSPVVRSVQVTRWRDSRPAVLQFHLTYQGDAHMSVETELCLRVRGRPLAVLPIELAVSELDVELVLQVLLDPSLEGPSVRVSLVEEPFVDFDVFSELGHTTATLKDLPHIRNILRAAITRGLSAAFVAPQCFIWTGKPVQLGLAGEGEVIVQRKEDVVGMEEDEEEEEKLNGGDHRELPEDAESLEAELNGLRRRRVMAAS